MMLEMKPIVRIFLAAVLCFCALNEVKAQTYELQIDSIVGLPDTIADGDTASFFIQISMNSPLFYQGEVYLELEYGGSFYRVDTTISQSFLSPNTPNTVQALHRFSTEDDLGIGDNVVVVWPRIGDGINNPPQNVLNPYTTVVTLVEPNGINEQSGARTFRSFLLPNPASTGIEIRLAENEKIAYSRLYDLTGQLLSEGGNERRFDISHLPLGLYFVDVLTEDGHIYTDKLLISR
jgi:hypothetical protein